MKGTGENTVIAFFDENKLHKPIGTFEGVESKSDVILGEKPHHCIQKLD